MSNGPNGYLFSCYSCDFVKRHVKQNVKMPPPKACRCGQVPPLLPPCYATGFIHTYLHQLVYLEVVHCESYSLLPDRFSKYVTSFHVYIYIIKTRSLSVCVFVCACPDSIKVMGIESTFIIEIGTSSQVITYYR